MASSISPSDCVLLHADGFKGSIFHQNATTAVAFTSRRSSIEVSLSCPERPLLPTILFVECFGVDFISEPPHIVSAVEDILLFRVLIGPRPPIVLPSNYDYFIYRVGGKRGPTLDLLPPPHPTFLYEDAGLLPRGDDGFTIAALISTGTFGVYDLHRFDSVTWTWNQVEVQLVAPQAAFPCKIPMNAGRLCYHLTSTVITIGGDGGTMGWVDLWRGILLCDVLHPEPKLRGVPLPLPLELLTCNNGQGADIGGCAKSLRGIAFVDHCLRFVHLEAITTNTLAPAAAGSDSDSDEETAVTHWAMHDWVITTWSNSKMTASWKDWNMDCKAKASETKIHSSLKTKMLNSGLLSPVGANQARALQNLYVSHPAPGMDDGVVYLLARLKFQAPKAFVIALDTRNNVLLGSAEFATERKRGAGVVYFPSNISRYIDPEARVLPIPKGDENGSSWDESSLHEGTESLELPKIIIRFPWLGVE